MPFYEYQCKNCGHDLEAMQKINDAPLKKCPHCGKSQLQRLMSAPVFRLKGGGWYETDFKGDGDNKKNLADKPDADAPKDAAKDTDKDKGKDAAKEASKEGAGTVADGKGKDGKGKDGKTAEAGGAKDAPAAGNKSDDKPAGKAAAESVKKPTAGKRSVRGRAVRPVRKPAAKAKRRR
jgi:putative FmdB family regulatory protein